MKRLALRLALRFLLSATERYHLREMAEWWRDTLTDNLPWEGEDPTWWEDSHSATVLILSATARSNDDLYRRSGPQAGPYH